MTTKLLLGSSPELKKRVVRLSSILTAEGTSAQTRRYFYKAIVQAVRLYGSEAWTLSESMLKQFESFHRWVVWYLTGRHIRQLEDGTRHYPSLAGVLRDAGLFSIKEYIRRSRRTVRLCVGKRPILEACRQPTVISTNVNNDVWWILDMGETWEEAETSLRG